MHQYLEKNHSDHFHHLPFIHIWKATSTDLIQVIIKTTKTTLHVISSSIQSPEVQTTESEILILDKVEIITPKINWFMNTTSSTPSTSNLLNHLVQGTAYAVNDSSFYLITQKGACAWIMSTSDGFEWI